MKNIDTQLHQIRHARNKDRILYSYQNLAIVSSVEKWMSNNTSQLELYYWTQNRYSHKQGTHLLTWRYHAAHPMHFVNGQEPMTIAWHSQCSHWVQQPFHKKLPIHSSTINEDEADSRMSPGGRDKEAIVMSPKGNYMWSWVWDRILIDKVA